MLFYAAKSADVKVHRIPFPLCKNALGKEQLTFPAEVFLSRAAVGEGT